MPPCLCGRVGSTLHRRRCKARTLAHEVLHACRPEAASAAPSAVAAAEGESDIAGAVQALVRHIVNEDTSPDHAVAAAKAPPKARGGARPDELPSVAPQGQLDKTLEDTELLLREEAEIKKRAQQLEADMVTRTASSRHHSWQQTSGMLDLPCGS